MDETPGLFERATLFDFPTEKCAFCENGRRKMFATHSGEELILFLMDGENRRKQNLPWDLAQYPVVDMHFDPSARWLLVLCPTALRIVPALAFLEPELKHDVKWPVRDITTLPVRLEPGRTATAVVWWQTELSQPIAVVGDQTGGLIFFSLDTNKIIRKSYIVGKVCKLSIYIDDDLDSVILLITSSKNRQWNLTLEKRLNRDRPAEKKKLSKGKDGNRKFDDFLTTLKEIGSDRMNSLFQIRSQSTSNVPDKLTSQLNSKNPTPISLTLSRDDTKKSSNEECEIKSNDARWFVSPQSADGRHFLSIFNSVRGTFTLHRNIDDRSPMYAFKFKDVPVDLCKVIWQQRIIYLFAKNTMEIHSSNFATQEDGSSHTVIWEDFFEDGEYFIDAWSVNESSNDPHYDVKWSDTTEIAKLDLPRYNLGSCLVVSNKRTYLLSTRNEVHEWIVEQLVEGRGGIERLAAALKIPLRPLLTLAADILLARRNFLQALPKYRLAKLASDDIINRLGALGMYSEIIMSGISPQSTDTANICLYVHVLLTIMDDQHLPTLLNYVQNFNQFSPISNQMLLTRIGLWDAVEIISFKRGHLWSTFQALMANTNSPCRGCLSSILNKHYTQFLITDQALPFLKYIDQYCEIFDTTLLKKLCIWMCPLQDCFRILYRALSTSQPNTHLSKMRRLIRTFFGVISTLHSRISSSKTQMFLNLDGNINNFSSSNSSGSNQNAQSEIEPQCVVSCGHTHWGVTSNGKIKLTLNSDCFPFVDVDLSLMGKALSVSCGRDHTLILTENGLYSMGDNRFGQLGIDKNISISDVPLLIGVQGKDYSENMVNEAFAWYGEKIIQISAGQYHSACVTDLGNLYTWGWGIHGQLAHGTIYNESIPKKVLTMKSEKVTYVGCGSCHTALLTASKQVYVCGNSAFGQIGDSGRQKSNIPIKVNLGHSPVVMIAVGYFHTLALLKNNELWTWGCSPQKLRLGARSAKRKAISVNQKTSQDDNYAQLSSSVQMPPSPVVDDDFHLYPTRVDTSNVTGTVIKMAAGWHHSCLVDSNGLLYVWGLNLDCQLGTGNRNEVFIPTVVEMPKTESDEKKMSRMRTVNNKLVPSVGCGGDFTVFVNFDGKVFATGNTALLKPPNKKGELKVVMFKNTTRIIRLPNIHNLQRTFRYITTVDDVDYHDSSSSINSQFKWPKNPITSIDSFQNSHWASSLLRNLHQFVDDDTPLLDNHLRALLSILRGDYAEALNLQLNNLFAGNQMIVPTYLQHTTTEKDESIDDDSSSVEEMQCDDVPMSTSHIISFLQDEIKCQSRLVLLGETTNKSLKLSCQCSEDKYILPDSDQENTYMPVDDITESAVSVTKSIFNILPDNSNIWTECVDEATTFWIDHKLSMSELESIFLQKSINGHTIEMASAIFCSKEKIDYQKHLSPAFNLELCDNILQSW